jgi:hypothetical protein
MGNLLLLQDRPKEALGFLKSAATGDQRLRFPLYDLAWKFLAEAEIRRDVVPPTAEARRDYLDFLLQRSKMEPAFAAWEDVRKSKTPDYVKLSGRYVDQLIAAGMAERASVVWHAVLKDTAREVAQPDGELITNGDFEAGLPNMGLDWRLTPEPAYVIALDQSTAQSGAHSLSVTFDGSTNPEFHGIWQVVPVEPNREYQFNGYLKSENISTTNGLMFSIVAISGAETLLASTESIVGTNPWQTQHLDFRTGPATHFVRIVLRRTLSPKLDNLLQGKVWIDDISIKPRR